MKKTLNLSVSLLAALPLALLASGAQAQSASYAIDPTHTFANFEAKHFGISTIRGRFDKKEGAITIDPAAKTGKVEVTLDMSSVSTGVPALDAHLRKADFFDAEKFPTAKFEGSQFVFEGTKIKSVSGTLTMLGKTAPVTLVADAYACFEHPRLKREVCGGDFSATIQRSQWGMTYALPAVTPDNIRLLIQVEAVKQQ